MEDVLSQLTSTEETVIFSSGYLAGQTIAAILGQNSNIFIAPGSHPSIRIAGCEMPEESFTEWIDRITSQINNSNEQEFILVADSVNIFEGIMNDFSFVKAFPMSKKFILLIDDSHGIGVIGENGEGIASTIPGQQNVECIYSYSLSKAFNIQGGAVSTSSRFCKIIREHPNYSGSSSMSPAAAYAFLKSTELYHSQKLKLEENIAEFINCADLPFKKQRLPIFICNQQNAVNIFYDNHIIISSFSYPFSDSILTNRVIINALHNKEDIHKSAALWNLLQ